MCSGALRILSFLLGKKSNECLCVNMRSYKWGSILRVSSSRVLACRCGFRQVWLSVSRASCCVRLGLSCVIGDQTFCSSVSPSECQDKPASSPILVIHYLTSSHPMKSAFLLLRPRPMHFRIHILYAPVPLVEYYMVVLGVSVSATLPVNCSGTKVVLFIVLVNY
jgi:hypothetical protein